MAERQGVAVSTTSSSGLLAERARWNRLRDGAETWHLASTSRSFVSAPGNCWKAKRWPPLHAAG